MSQQYVVTGKSSKIPLWIQNSPELTFMGDSVDESKVSIYVHGVKANVGDIILCENNVISLVRNT